MTTRFFCMWHRRKLYRVVSAGEELFCGTAEECKRFLEIHHRKEIKAQVSSLRTPRRRHPTVRIYRMAPRGLRRAAV